MASNYNKLSEKDELIKSLRGKKTENEALKKSIDFKLNALENNKTVKK